MRECTYCHRETEGELKVKTRGKVKTFPCCDSQFCLDGILRNFTFGRQFVMWSLKKQDTRGEGTSKEK